MEKYVASSLQQWTVGSIDGEIVPFSAEMDPPDKIVYVQQKWKNTYTCINVRSKNEKRKRYMCNL
jgi:hypothetical protein